MDRAPLGCNDWSDTRADLGLELVAKTESIVIDDATDDAPGDFRFLSGATKSALYSF